MRRIYNRFVPIFFTLLMVTSISMSSGNNEIDVSSYASEDLIHICDSLYQLYGTTPNSLGLYEDVALKLKSQLTVDIDGKNYCAIVIACMGFGEFILLDSCSSKEVLLRKEMNVPGAHVSIEGNMDLNNDGFDEIAIYLSGGAHGMHCSFLSVYNDSLSFIKNGRGGISFFAMSGDVVPKDIDGDGIYELIVGGVVEKGQKENYTIHKWDGEKYTIHEKVAR